MITTTFEEQFERLVNTLPMHINADNTALQIRFDWGSHDKLIEFMAIPENISKYPLIWLVEGKDKEDRVKGTISRDAKIIIATQSIGVSRRNREIYTMEYSGILNPVKNNLITALECSGISRMENEIGVSRIQEYSWNNVDKNAVGDVWMVILIEATITFDTNNCINSIRF